MGLGLAGAAKTPVFFWKLARVDILTIRDRYLADDAAHGGWHFFQVDELARLVHRHQALALSVTQVEGGLETGDAFGPGCLVDLVEGQFDRLACGLARNARQRQ